MQPIHLFRSHDENGKFLYTPVPNPLIYTMFYLEKYTQREMKILLYICRMSYGIEMNEVTQYLSLERFAQDTGLAETHVSATIKKLVGKGVILKCTHKTNEFMYSISLFKYHGKMKHFKEVKAGYVLQEKEYVIGHKGKLEDSLENGKGGIVYSHEGSEKVASLKQDKQANDLVEKILSANKKTAKTTNTANVGNFVKAPVVLMGDHEHIEPLLVNYEADIRKDGSVEMLLEYMIKLDKYGFSPEEAYMRKVYYYKNGYTAKQFEQLTANHREALKKFSKRRKT